MAEPPFPIASLVLDRRDEWQPGALMPVAPPPAPPPVAPAPPAPVPPPVQRPGMEVVGSNKTTRTTVPTERWESERSRMVDALEREKTAQMGLAHVGVEQAKADEAAAANDARIIREETDAAAAREAEQREVIKQAAKLREERNAAYANWKPRDFFDDPANGSRAVATIMGAIGGLASHYSRGPNVVVEGLMRAADRDWNKQLQERGHLKELADAAERGHAGAQQQLDVLRLERNDKIAALLKASAAEARALGASIGTKRAEANAAAVAAELDQKSAELLMRGERDLFSVVERSIQLRRAEPQLTAAPGTPGVDGLGIRIPGGAMIDSTGDKKRDAEVSASISDYAVLQRSIAQYASDLESGNTDAAEKTAGNARSLLRKLGYSEDEAKDAFPTGAPWHSPTKWTTSTTKRERLSRLSADLRSRMASSLDAIGLNGVAAMGVIDAAIGGRPVASADGGRGGGGNINEDLALLRSLPPPDLSTPQGREQARAMRELERRGAR